MAITTLDGVIAGTAAPLPILKVTGAAEAAGVLHSLFYGTGTPGAATAPSPGLSGAALTSYAGQIPFTNPSGAAKTYLARMVMSCNLAGAVILHDRLWHNSGITVTTTTAQTVNSATWPARDVTGTTNGDGVQIAIEVSTATTNGSPVTNATMSYTNQAGTSGQTATMAAFPATAAAGSFIPFQLAAGDTGVRSVQSVTLGTSLASGTVHLVAFRQLAFLPLPTANIAAEINPITGGFPQLFDNTVPGLLWLPNNSSAPTLTGQIHYAQG